MAALRSLSFCLLAVGLLLPPAAASTGQTITAEPGQNVTLPCGAEKGKTIRAVEWSRADLDPVFVFLYIDGRFHPDRLHPSFRNRTYLQDRDMKNGDVSLILKNVKMKDTGRYQCAVTQGEPDLELISSIHLVVSPPPGPPTSTPGSPTSTPASPRDASTPSDGWSLPAFVGLVVGGVVGVLFVGLVVVVIHKRREISQCIRELKLCLKAQNSVL